MKHKKLTGENYPHTKMMNLEEWKQFAKNYKPGYYIINGREVKTKTIKEYLIKHVDGTFKELIYNGFVLRFSPEGHRYWNSISKRTKPVE